MNITVEHLEKIMRELPDADTYRDRVIRVAIAPRLPTMHDLRSNPMATVQIDHLTFWRVPRTEFSGRFSSYTWELQL